MPISLQWVCSSSLFTIPFLLMVIIIVLDPRKKFRHFKKNWGEEADKVKETVCERVCVLLLFILLTHLTTFTV